MDGSRCEQQGVAVVLDVGNDPLDARRLAVHVLGEVGFAGPSALDGVQQVALDVLVLAAAQTDVHPPDQGGVAVGHRAELRRRRR